MSGHSKWKTIQHKKNAMDAKRGKIFSRLSKEIIISAKAGGGNPDNNPSLRTIMLKARASNMPNDNIERAIKRGTGEIAGATIEEVTYEGFASGGIGIIAVALTDNRNRAAAEIRHIFTKHGSSFAGQGAVARGFKRKGQILVDASAVEEDKLMGIVLEAGADDMSEDDGHFEIVTEPGKFQPVVDALEKAGIKMSDAEVTFIPDVYVPVKEKGVASTVLRFISDLEDNDDIQNVYSNMDIDDEILKEIGQAHG